MEWAPGRTMTLCTACPEHLEVGESKRAEHEEPEEEGPGLRLSRTETSCGNQMERRLGARLDFL